MSQFPLCEKAGLRCRTLGASLGLFISAAEVEAYLRETTQQNSVKTESVRRNEGTNYAEGAENKVTQSDNKEKENPVRDQEDAGELVFRAEDFGGHVQVKSHAGNIAAQANYVLKRWREKQNGDSASAIVAELATLDGKLSSAGYLNPNEMSPSIFDLIERARALRAKGGG